MHTKINSSKTAISKLKPILYYFLAIFILISILYLFISLTSLSEDPEGRIKNQFQDFIKRYNKNYKDTNEFEYRYSIFRKNFVTIARHNQQRLSFKLKINKFADLTIQEFKERNKGMLSLKNLNKLKEGSKDDIQVSQNEPNSILSSQKLPEQIDWVEKGACGPIKDQGNCGSCFSFAAISTIESAYFLKYNKYFIFSEQQVVDCSIKYGNQACDGGYPHLVYDYFSDYLVETEENYPYVSGQTEKKGTCHHKKQDGVTNVHQYKLEMNDVPNFLNDTKKIKFRRSELNHEQHLKQWVAIQPIAIAIASSCEWFEFYSHGIIDRDCGQGIDDIDHAIVAVGYGIQNGQKYWKIRNSWSEEWGDGGYALIKRDESAKSTGLFGLANYQAYPILV